MQALFPISVDSRNVSTEVMLRALEAGLRPFQKVTFLIADRIQVYNDLAKMCGDLPRMAALDWSGGYRRDVVERTRWLSKVRHRLVGWPVGQVWDIIGFADLSDAPAFEALRSVWLLYQIDRSFRKDVDEATDNFIESHVLCKKSSDLARLSKVYVIEEIAINLRVRVLRSIYSEYYIGKTLPVLTRLYSGEYLKSVDELISPRRRRTAAEFRFFEWDGTGWMDVRANDHKTVQHKGLRVI